MDDNRREEIQRQIEFYFSDYILIREDLIRNIMEADCGYVTFPTAQLGDQLAVSSEKRGTGPDQDRQQRHRSDSWSGLLIPRWRSLYHKRSRCSGGPPIG